MMLNFTQHDGKVARATVPASKANIRPGDEIIVGAGWYGTIMKIMRVHPVEITAGEWGIEVFIIFELD